MSRPLRVAVVGAGVAGPALEGAAEAVGRALAEAGAVVVCGGRTGVMAAAARGCASAGGLAVGVLPGAEAAEANAWIGLPLPTGMGDGRNVLVVRFAESVVAVGGAWGTLSEIALASKMGRSVVLLGEGPVDGLPLPRTDDPGEAAARAIEAARAYRSGAGR